MRLLISSHLSNSINGGWLCNGCCLAIQDKNLYLLLGEQQEGTNACLGQGYKVPEQCPDSLKVLFLSSTLVLHPKRLSPQEFNLLSLQHSLACN